MLEQYGDILTIEELCKILKIGRNRVYKLLETKKLGDSVLEEFGRFQRFLWKII